MNALEFATEVRLHLVAGVDSLAIIETGYCSDLLSDAIANAPVNSVFITVQAHKNTVAVATLVGVPLIILCNNRIAPLDMIDAAIDKKIGIAQTEKSQFEISILVHTILTQTR